MKTIINDDDDDAVQSDPVTQVINKLTVNLTRKEFLSPHKDDSWR